MKVSDLERKLVPDTWTADVEGALLEMGPCPRDKSCVGCRRTELAASGFFATDRSEWNLSLNVRRGGAGL